MSHPLGDEILGLFDVNVKSMPAVKPAKQDKLLVTNSYVLSVTTPPAQILAHAPKRTQATIIVAYGGTTTIVFGTSFADVQAAVQLGTVGGANAVAYLTSVTKTTFSFFTNATTELWAASIVDAGVLTVVSAIKEYCE